jgi:peptidoglycan/LPS O-acetylase OafA/YrhL
MTQKRRFLEMGQKRILELDVLRGFAIVLVMGVHVPAYPIWSTFGGFGVDLFFVLSGFLISNLLFTEYRKTADIRFTRFFLRRALKLFPSFYLLLLLTILYCLIWHVPFTKRDLLGELFLAQNYVGSIWGHTWSLAVEEHFYILLPLLLAFIMKCRKGSEDVFRPIPYLFAVLAVACLALRVYNAAEHPNFDHKVHYEPSHLRFDSLFFGVFLSYLHNFRSEILRKAMNKPWRFPISVLSILGLVPAAFLASSDPIVYTAGFTLLYISFGTMLLLSLYQETDRSKAKSNVAVWALAKMGVYSYTLYLWHVPMAQVFASLAPRFPMVNQYVLHALYFATSIAIGVLASKLVEAPILKLRERLLPPSTSEWDACSHSAVNTSSAIAAPQMDSVTTR